MVEKLRYDCGDGILMKRKEKEEEGGGGNWVGGKGRRPRDKRIEGNHLNSYGLFGAGALLLQDMEPRRLNENDNGHMYQLMSSVISVCSKSMVYLWAGG